MTLSRLKKIQGKKNDAKAEDDAKRAAAKEAGIAAGRCFTVTFELFCATAGTRHRVHVNEPACQVLISWISEWLLQIC